MLRGVKKMLMKKISKLKKGLNHRFFKNNILKVNFKKLKSKRNVKLNYINDETIVDFCNKFIPEMMDTSVMNEQTIHLTEYFRSSKDLEIDLDNKEKPDLKIVDIGETIEFKEDRYNKFLEYIKLHSSTKDGKILVTNNEIISNLKLSKKILETLKTEGCNNGDLVVKNGRTYINLKE